jgi:hypothetical protein
LRGITLNHENAKRLQYDRFRTMVLNFGMNDSPVECVYNRIGPEQSSKVMTKNLIKKYNVVNNKGLVSEDLILYPFGF